MSTRSILGLIYMVQGLKQLGEDPEPVLSRHGLSLDKLDPGTRISRTTEQRFYADMAEHLHDPLVGLRLGSYYGLAGYGPLTMLLMTCATALDAFQMGIRYQELTYLYGKLHFEPGPDVSALILTPMPMTAHAFRFRVDGEVSGTYKMVRDMQATMGMDLHALRIDMPYPRPEQAAAYEAHFGCPVRFGEPVARFWMRNEDLRRRLPTADANAHAMYRQLCEQQLVAQRQADKRLTDQVLNHLSLFKDHAPTATDVAKAFGLSERTFRRNLNNEGSHYRDLLAQARYEKAQHLLRHTAQSIDDIAQHLGYAEAAAFIHAFQRWAGQTPSAFRKSVS
ncbi:MAG: AraC family transcriptional regulator [Burkholderiales bacterium]|nr:AraC family transcriptional regulator [Burkholderiales bacterium]